MSDAALGWYVYCVVPAEEHPPLDGLVGVDPDSGVDVVTHAGVAAPASPVPLRDFGAEALRRNLEDLAWLERTARAHNAVLARMLTGESVVPMRLCTIFTRREHVVDMLAREYEALRGELERLRGQAEWSVKIVADRAVVEAAAREREPEAATTAAGSESPGRDYLTRKKRDQGRSETARALLESAVERTHQRLRREARESALLPLQSPKLSQRAGQMVLNGAYLVERTHADAFANVAHGLREEQRALGLELELAGPWAPYSFVTAKEVSE